MDELKKLIREVPDFPKPGINFYDITTLLKHPDGLRQTVDALAAQYEGVKIDTVVGIEARGFIFAPALAYHLGAGFVPVRKPKKLPAKTARVSYDLEYGADSLRLTLLLLSPQGSDIHFSEERVDLERAIERLPAGYREVFVLHDVEGYTHEEIGGLLGIESGTSKSQLSRARQRLRAALAPAGWRSERRNR